MTVSGYDAVVIGASAGALESLSAILPSLPREYALTVFIVVHLPPDRKSLMAELLQNRCLLDVREVQDKQPIEPGVVYLAPPDYHLLVESNDRLSLSSEEPVQYSRPSIDVLFETAAEVYGSRVVGVVLSGANSDGSRGLRAVVDAGGAAVVQDPASSSSAAMPLAALDACPKAASLSLPEIAEFLSRLTTSPS